MSNSDHEIYPMPLFPQLTVSNVEESTAWYETLGFEVIYSMPVMSHVRYRKYADIMLVAERDNGDEESASADADSSQTPARGRGVVTYITVEDESVDDVTNRAEENGIEISVPPHETNWNTRETTVHDPDGYELVFSERAEVGRELDEVMGSVEE
ncbi:VOC family protein [Haladaptatus sp.]|uniref:VOC family protein n=1 Tax=Haladaptatus sp. TaxID=1973141 RepID=UPI003C6430AB